MGHNICIDENTGKASIFVVKEPAWHGLGQVVPVCVYRTVRGIKISESGCGASLLNFKL